MANDEAGEDGETDLPGSASGLDWKSQEILRTLLKADGTADVGELRTRLGEENGSPVNYRVKNKLKPEGLVSVARPGVEEGRQRAKVISLTELGEDVAEELLGQDSDEDDTLSLDERFNRLEAGLDSKYGLWDLDRRRQFELTVELSRVMRDFLGEKYPEEFQEYAEEHFDPDTVEEDN